MFVGHVDAAAEEVAYATFRRRPVRWRSKIDWSILVLKERSIVDSGTVQTEAI